MSATMHVFDRRAVRLHRDRAAATVHRVSPVLAEVADRLLERLDAVARDFTAGLDVGGRGVVAPLLRARGVGTVATDLSPRMALLSGETCVATDEEFLPFAAGTFDLVIANLSLHWVNDLPGALIQLRRVLRPDGLFLASVPVLGTLAALRTALMEAEATLSEGVSPRVSPFPELRDCAGLLQRAGFALPVADLEVVLLEYESPLALLRDLRDAGETNAIALRDRRPPSRTLFAQALGALPTNAAGRYEVPLHVAMLTGWAPSSSQPKPLHPGQGQVSLADVLGGGRTG